ncbi:hypothetical protein [Streptomyces sp. NBC_00648]|uniref:hypothetical protein n=1 Tax=Streptomyces sp. NBC_00648 TaxID=2975797 RepID=UPI0032538A49
MSQSASFIATAATWVACWTYGTKSPPILSLNESGGNLSVHVFTDEPLDVHRTFAKDLADAATAYAMAVEEWAAAQSADTPPTGG